MLAKMCNDALVTLSRAMISCANDGYSLDKMERLTTALFTVGGVASDVWGQKLEKPPTDDETRAWMARHFVLRTLLDETVHTGDIRKALPTLAAVASSVPQLSQAIIELYEWSTTEDATRQALEADFSAHHIGILYRLAFGGQNAVAQVA